MQQPTPIHEPEVLTRLLKKSNAGDDHAQAELIRLLYQQLRLLAHQQIRKSGHSPTLCTTALVNEAWLRLFAGELQDFNNRRHFFGCAALAMRQLLIDYARAKNTEKRGAEVPMPTIAPQVGAEQVLNLDELLELDQALTRLETLDHRLGKIVELRFFTGLSISQVSEVLECSERTVVRDWRKARAFLAANAADFSTDDSAASA